MAIEMMSMVGSDGNNRQRASAQRGSMSLTREREQAKSTFVCLVKEEELHYLTVTSDLNRFVLIPGIEQMQCLVEGQCSTRTRRAIRGGGKVDSNVPRNPVDVDHPGKGSIAHATG